MQFVKYSAAWTVDTDMCLYVGSYRYKFAPLGVEKTTDKLAVNISIITIGT